MNLTPSEGPFLILSDLHIGHSATRVTEVESLAPLFQSGQTVIFNGDTFEMRRKADREASAIEKTRLEALLQAAGTRGLYLTGNHDPQVSEVDFVDFVEEKILLTHGDILFHDVAPWSLNAPLYRRAHDSELKRLPAGELNDFSTRLRALRRATLAYDVGHAKVSQGTLGFLVHVAETTWPPWRPLLILKCWREVPGLAAKTAAHYRPGTRWFIMGHSHRAGIWKKDGLTVINTGAMMRGFERTAVLIEGRKMEVRRVDFRGGKFVLGKTVASLAV